MSKQAIKVQVLLSHAIEVFDQQNIDPIVYRSVAPVLLTDALKQTEVWLRGSINSGEPQPALIGKICGLASDCASRLAQVEKDAEDFWQRSIGLVETGLHYDPENTYLMARAIKLHLKPAVNDHHGPENDPAAALIYARHWRQVSLRRIRAAQTAEHTFRACEELYFATQAMADCQRRLLAQVAETGNPKLLDKLRLEMDQSLNNTIAIIRFVLNPKNEQALPEMVSGRQQLHLQEYLAATMIHLARHYDTSLYQNPGRAQQCYEMAHIIYKQLSQSKDGNVRDKARQEMVQTKSALRQRRSQQPFNPHHALIMAEAAHDGAGANVTIDRVRVRINDGYFLSEKVQNAMQQMFHNRGAEVAPAL